MLEEQNVTRAAARLHLSQPTVSAQLNRLREMFNDPLLIPAQRGMIPTARALELRSPLHGALNQVRDTLTTHQHFEPGQAELTLILACTDYLQEVIGLSVVSELRSKAPNIRVGLRALEPSRLEAQMADGEVDLAFMTPKEAPPVLRSRHLYDETYVLVGRQGHPHIFDGMMIEDYVQLEHVVVSLSGGGFYTSIDQILETLGQSRKVVLSVASFLLIPGLVAQSDLVALVPQRLVAERKDLKVVASPIQSAGFSVGMVWHERSHSHSAHRWIRDLIRHTVSN